VVRDGKLVYERYFASAIEYGPDTLHDVHSITKSAIALLVGDDLGLAHGWVVDQVFLCSRHHHGFWCTICA